MKKFALTLTSTMLIAAVSGCSENTAPNTDVADKPEMQTSKAPSNPLLAEYSGPYSGVPAFDKMDLADLKPALEKGMAINLKEIDAIVADTSPATFENTIVPLEKAGADLGRVFTYWGIWSANKNSPEFRAIQGEMVPVISAHFSKINQNETLFSRVKAVYEGEEYKTLTDEQQRVTWLNYNGFARNGATLEGDAKKRYADINQEVASLQTQFANNVLADEDITIKPWDYRYYAEKVRKQKYDLDSDEVKQYLELDKLRDAMFYVAGELFNFKFTPVAEGSVPVFHEDVKVWDVTDLTSGEHIGLWYLDPFARKGKRSGAWATTYRSHTTYDGKQTVLSSNNSNFVKGPEGEPTLISFDDAETYFHEFGHALHFLSATVAYPTSHSGVRDYTEFQSQLLERWLTTDEVINNYLVHYKTGEPIPQELVAKIKKAATFNEGFKTT